MRNVLRDLIVGNLHVATQAPRALAKNSTVAMPVVDRLDVLQVVDKDAFPSNDFSDIGNFESSLHLHGLLHSWDGLQC